MRQNYPKGVSLAVVTVMYACAVGEGVFAFMKAVDFMPEAVALLLSDIVATVVIWAFGVAYENVSIYDPYWSVLPPVAFTLWAIYKHCWSVPVILLLIAVWYWGIRLTGNWACTFKGIGHEDWRYTHYRDTLSPFLFHMTNFFGLNLMPTLLVFACMMPGFGLYETGAPAGGLTWLGFALCVLAATIQLAADTQIHRFRTENQGKVCNIGLWKNGRHPNYFGEILFWWGVWTMYASARGIDWLILGPVAMTALFLFISIPMMERRQLANKPDYAEYRKKTRLLI